MPNPFNVPNWQLPLAGAPAPVGDDPWHVGELPGDGGLIIRDQNGLEVLRCSSPAEAAALIASLEGGA